MNKDYIKKIMRVAKTLNQDKIDLLVDALMGVYQIDAARAAEFAWRQANIAGLSTLHYLP
ncbi:MAG: hypothetical protein WCY05_07010 [Candidatus Omnitrophota bacterium]